MKKILFFATIPSSIKEFSLDMMRFLRTSGHGVSAAAGLGSQTEYVRDQGFVCYDFPIPRGIDPIGDCRAFKAFKKILRQGRYDLIMTQTAKAGFIGRLAAKLAKAPLVIHTAHAWPFHPFLSAWQKYYYLWLEKIAANLCDAVIVDTETVRRYGLEFKVAPPEKIHQIYMGIDTQKFHPKSTAEKSAARVRLGFSEEQIIVGAIARLVPDKGIETLIECAKLLKNQENLLFVLLGEGPLRPFFEKKIQEYGLEKRFLMPGYINNVAPYHDIFDIFFLPTLREGFGVVFAEAMAAGVPVIASDIPPLNNEVIIKDKTGFLAAPTDVPSFVQHLQKLLSPGLRREMGEQGRRHVVQNFDIQKINQETLNLISALWRKKFNADFK